MSHTPCLTASFVLAATTAFAGNPVVETLDYHNVHIRVSDPAKAGAWYVNYLGATPGGAPQLVYFGRTLVEFMKTDNPQPSAGRVVS